MSRFVAAVDSTTGQIDYFTAHESGDPLPYGYDGGLSSTQVLRVYTVQPHRRLTKDDGAGNLIAKTQSEINAYDRAQKAQRMAPLEDLARPSDEMRILLRMVAAEHGWSRAQLRTKWVAAAKAEGQS